MTNSAPRQSSATPSLPDRAETRSGFWRLPGMTNSAFVVRMADSNYRAAQTFWFQWSRMWGAIGFHTVRRADYKRAIGGAL